LEGLESSKLKKLKIFPEDMYPAAPKPISGFFFYAKNSDRGSIVVFSGSLSEVGGSWSLCGECSAVTGRIVLKYSFGYVILVYCSFTYGHFF
jgi:hypothetical protein